jgi:hypothetical protein
MNSPLNPRVLANGLRLEFFDQSNRYFGDYHRVRILVRCAVAVVPEWLAEGDGPDQARRLLGESVCFERSLEQMGVATAQLAAVKQGLVESFLSASAGYLGSAAFPRRFLAQQLQARSQGLRRYRTLP